MSQLNHRWDITPQEAIAIQKQFSDSVKIQKLEQPIQYVGGADIAFNKENNTVFAAIVVLRYADMTVVSQASIKTEITFPYIPGLLSFRELPALLEVWDRLPIKPDVMMMDGQGLAHPRRFGEACHFGLWTDCPTFGCGKTRLLGNYEQLADAKGSTAEMLDKGEVIAKAVRTQNKINPVYISVGHKITLDEAVQIALNCAPKYRIPEPTRQADMLVNRLRREAKANGENTEL